MQILIKMIVISAFSAVSGLLAASLLIMYVRAGERIQFWSEKYDPHRKWIRRSLHSTLFILALLVFFYGFIFWGTIITESIKGISKEPGLKTTFFIFFTVLFCCPVFFLRRHIFRAMNVKKLWE